MCAHGPVLCGNIAECKQAVAAASIRSPCVLTIVTWLCTVQYSAVQPSTAQYSVQRLG